MDIANIIYLASTWVLPVVFAITLHEAAHGFVAHRLGDDTAFRLGRVSANPLRHIDVFGTFVLPALLLIGSGGRFMFGYAKPVPVAFHRLNNPRRDMVWVAAAGPLTNFIQAVIAALLLHTVPYVPDLASGWFGENLQNAMLINLVLGVFNLVPLPPLDGGRIAVGVLPDALAVPLARLERYGIFILIGLLFILPLLGNQIGMDLNIFEWVIWPIVLDLFRFIAMLTGHG